MESLDANSDVRGEGIPGAEQAKDNRNGIFLSTASHKDPAPSTPVCNCVLNAYPTHNPLILQLAKFLISLLKYQYIVLNCFTTKKTTARNRMFFLWAF